MSIGQAIRELRQERGWGQRDLAEKLTKIGFPISHQSIALREKGGVTVNPRERKFFAKAFEMTLEEFDQKWRASRVDMSRGGDGIAVINKTPAGLVVDYDAYGVDSGQGFEYIPRCGVTDPNAFALVVNGDSMDPHLKEGDYAIISSLKGRMTSIEVGMCVYVHRGNDAPPKDQGGCFARFLSLDDSGKLKFGKDNPKHKGFVWPSDEIDQIGEVVELRRTRRI